MRSKLYKLALWYIGKCNTKWDKPKTETKLLDRLTYKMFDKYVLFYGADAEWQNFRRYDVLDNAIQRLAQYENGEHEIRNKAIDEFAERLKGKIFNHFTYRGIIEEPTDYSDYIDEIAEEMKAGAQ